MCNERRVSESFVLLCVGSSEVFDKAHHELVARLEDDCILDLGGQTRRVQCLPDEVQGGDESLAARKMTRRQIRLEITYNVNFGARDDQCWRSIGANIAVAQNECVHVGALFIATFEHIRQDFTSIFAEVCEFL
jgi:hypothetical protein